MIDMYCLKLIGAFILFGAFWFVFFGWRVFIRRGGMTTSNSEHIRSIYDNRGE